MAVPWRRLELLYVVNASLLATHEIDSAYWHEWAMFGLPGGIQLFLALNLALLFAVFLGLRELVLHTWWGLWASLGLAVAGLAAFVIHATFLLWGWPEFRLPASLAILVLILVVSGAQAALTLGSLSRGRSGLLSP